MAGRAVAVNIRPAAAGACTKERPLLCHAVSGTSGAYRTTSGEIAVWVYGGGTEVTLRAEPTSAISVEKLIAAGRAVVKALG